MNQSTTFGHGFARMFTDGQWEVRRPGCANFTRDLLRSELPAFGAARQFALSFTLFLSVLISVYPWLIVFAKMKTLAK
jgi:hypothetical protein